MATKKPPRKGAAPAAPARLMVKFRLPEEVDELTGLLHRPTLSMPLFEVQADFADVGQTMDVSAIAASEDGFELDLIHGRLRYVMPGWSREWTRLGLPDRLVGRPARLAIVAVASAVGIAETKRKGRPPCADDFREFQIADVLVRMAQGLSMRAAVAASLEEHDPDSKDATLLSAVARHLRGDAEP